MFLDLSGKSILARSLIIFEKFDKADEIVVVTRECDIKEVENIKEKYTLRFSEVLVTEQNDVAINTIPFEYINNRVTK